MTASAGTVEFDNRTASTFGGYLAPTAAEAARMLSTSMISEPRPKQSG
ncbi:MAG: hypothetical protein U0892_12025 [Pirellulales bacterium]